MTCTLRELCCSPARPGGEPTIVLVPTSNGAIARLPVKCRLLVAPLALRRIPTTLRAIARLTIKGWFGPTPLAHGWRPFSGVVVCLRLSLQCCVSAGFAAIARLAVKSSAALAPVAVVNLCLGRVIASLRHQCALQRRKVKLPKDLSDTVCGGLHSLLPQLFTSIRPCSASPSRNFTFLCDELCPSSGGPPALQVEAVPEQH
mmetsp:Transcript_3991/g.10092  ORF Transcript_3991/g.10092 Transcript_3991/m.10092 type:complete len:202 (+) Transcript_3991:83-688(+)